ncbi:MAG: S41 family peptidase [Patescibacteria group bacterium]|nr:S41 family peptidase [Patescibacteria group bacterium]
MKAIFKVVILIVCFVGISFLSYQLGVFVGKDYILKTPPPQIINPDSKELEKVDFSVFWEAWRKLERDFLEKEKIDEQEMVYGAIKGMVNSLKDPHTIFFTPSQTKEFEEELSGKYEGVGMEIALRDNKITVVSPLEGTPAQKAGILPGDVILKVDETSTENISLEEAIRIIRGSEGTEVILLIQRESWEAPKEIKLERKVIKIPTLKWELLEGNIALIKIYQFNKIISSEFKKAALEILKSPTQKIILDLRNNPGGYLEEAVEIAGWFLLKGEVVVWQDLGEEKERKPYYSAGPGKFSQYLVVVLINEGSASGAEILAGALKDNRNILLIGKTSFGKGSVQEQISLSDNSSLKITIAKWLTPKGISIDKNGIESDIEVEMSAEDWQEGKDPQLEKAIEVIKDL